MPTLTVTRVADSAGLFRSIVVEVDGQEVAALGRRESCQVEVGPGTHTVQARMDWHASPLLEVEGDAEVEIEYPFRSIWKATKRSDDAIRIRRLGT